MTQIEQFYKKTIELINLLENKDETDRDIKIKKIDSLLDEREQMLTNISAPSSLEEKEVAKKTVKLNEKLAMLLVSEKNSIQKDIRKLQHKKESSNKYTNPYESLVGRDGVYYDRRN